MYEQVLASDKTSDITNNPTGTGYVRYAKVVNVYDSTTINTSTNYGKVDLVWLDTMDAVNGSVSITQPMYSNVHGCGIYSLPCVNDVAVCLQQQDGPPLILGFLPVNQYFAVTAGDKNGYGQLGYMPKLKSGEILIKSKSQSYIYFRNDGSINIRSYDGTNTSETLSEDVALNHAPIINRTASNESNVLVDISLGGKDKTSGSDVCRGTSVFSVSSGTCTTATATFQCIERQSVFSISNTNNYEVADIDFITIKEPSSDGTSSSVTKTLTTGFTFRTEYTYIANKDTSNGPYTDTCTVDSNPSTTFVTLDNKSAQYVTDSSILTIQYKLRQVNVKVAGSSTGDIAIDGNNIVLRANHGQAYLGLFEDGRVQLGGKQVEIGDRLHGHIKTSAAGVVASAGNIPNAYVHMAQPEEAPIVNGPVALFYINDAYPLFKYNFLVEDKNKRYSIVTYTEYSTYSDAQRKDILPRCFDPIDTIDGFTSDYANALIEATVKAGISVMPYGEMKTL